MSGRCVSAMAVVIGDPAGGPIQPAWEGFAADENPCAGGRTQLLSYGADLWAGADLDGGANLVEMWDPRVRARTSSETIIAFRS